MSYNLSETSLGLWVDLPKSMVLQGEFFEWFHEELLFDQMSVMIDDSDKAVDFSWNAKDVEKLVELADKRAIEIGLTTWPYPDLNQLLKMEQKMDELLSVGYISEWETDQEFNWGEDDVVDFPDLDKAGDALVDIKQRLCTKHECRDTVTTFTYHVENSAKADVAPHADRLMVQAYAVDEREGKPVNFGHRYGPGRMQKLTLDRALQVPGVKEGKVELGVGHAAWAQEGFTVPVKDTVTGELKMMASVPKQAMRVSFEAALKYHPTTHSWWSAKYVYPPSWKHLPYAEAFLKSLRA